MAGVKKAGRMINEFHVSEIQSKLRSFIGMKIYVVAPGGEGREMLRDILVGDGFDAEALPLNSFTPDLALNARSGVVLVNEHGMPRFHYRISLRRDGGVKNGY